MPAALQRLLDYYQSPIFVEDFKRLEEGRTVDAKVRRWSLTDQLNAYLMAEGIRPTEEQFRVQQAFAAGEMPIDQMLEHMKLYVAIISAWSQK